jgi:hypothetical protein
VQHARSERVPATLGELIERAGYPVARPARVAERRSTSTTRSFKHTSRRAAGVQEQAKPARATSASLAMARAARSAWAWMSSSVARRSVHSPPSITEWLRSWSTLR